MCSTLQALAHQAMRERHWRAIMAITGKELNLAEDVFKLQHLLDCNLLAHRCESGARMGWVTAGGEAKGRSANKGSKNRGCCRWGGWSGLLGNIAEAAGVSSFNRALDGALRPCHAW